jgi:putative ABC transport system ATP-binding protein
VGRNSLFKVENLSKDYKMGDITVNALKHVSLDIEAGELVVILGPSGSGKSTLLNIMGGMDIPTFGKVYFNEKDISNYNENELTTLRREEIGFIFQFYNLMPSLTAKENIEMACDLAKKPLKVMEILKQVGLEGREKHFPSQMSGGEQQRVAIARAVAKNPEVLLCDEPTGALDFSTGVKVLKLLSTINKEYGKTVVIITHNQPIAQMADKVIRMGSGEIVSIKKNQNPADAESIEW